MRYIKIPIKDEQEGKDIVENYMGLFMWRRMDDGSLEAYPYDSDNPVIISSLSHQVDTPAGGRCGG